MEHIYTVVSMWLGIAVVSAIVAYHLKLSIALIEIISGILISFLIKKFFGVSDYLMENSMLIKFLADCGALFLTFLAGAEIDNRSIRTKFKEAGFLGTAAFLFPFIAVFLFSYYLLNLPLKQSVMSAIILSSTSIAIIYSVMISSGLNNTSFGKGILASCFVNGFMTLFFMSVVFSSINYKMVIYIIYSILLFFLFPKITSYLTGIYGNKTAAIRIKFISFIIFASAVISLWSDNHPVLLAYIIGLSLGELLTRHKDWVHRMRSLTVGFFTPFYFIRVGMLCNLDVLRMSFSVILILFLIRFIMKIVGVYPLTSFFRKKKQERWYYTFLLTTGLTFDTIVCVFAYNNGIINEYLYSIFIMVIILSAVIPAIFANIFTPVHLLSGKKHSVSELKELEAEE